MEKGRAMEFWIEIVSEEKEYDHIRTWKAWSEPLHTGLGIHVREVIELTEDEKRRVKKLRNMNTTESEAFLLDLLERAGVC